MCAATHSVRDSAHDGPMPITIEWGVAFRLGPKSAALKAVRQAMYKPPPGPTAALLSEDGSITGGVRDAFEQFDRDRSGLLGRPGPGVGPVDAAESRR